MSEARGIGGPLTGLSSELGLELRLVIAVCLLAAGLAFLAHARARWRVSKAWQACSDRLLLIGGAGALLLAAGLLAATAIGGPSSPLLIVLLSQGSILAHLVGLTRLARSDALELLALRASAQAPRRSPRDLAERLREAELCQSRFAALAHIAPCGIISTDLAGVIKFFNSGAEALYGFRRDEVLGRDIAVLQTAHAWQTLVGAAKSLSEVFTLESRQVTKNGQPIDVVLSVQQVSYGEDIELCAVSQDITRIKRLQTEVAHQKALYRQLFNFFPHLVWLADAKGVPLYFNQKWLMYTGLSEVESAERGWLAVIQAGDADEFGRSFEHYTRTGEGFAGDVHLRSQWGTYKEFSYHIKPVCDHAGKITNWIGAFVDVSDKMRLYRQVQQSEERLRLIMTSLKEHCIVMLNPNGDIETWPEPCETLTGYKAEDAIGRSLAMLLHKKKRRAACDGGLLLLNPNLSEPTRQEHWIYRKDGTRFFAEVAFAPISHVGSPLIGFSVVIHDISDRKHEEAAKYRDLFENAPDIYLSFDPGNGEIIECNNMAAESLGFPKSEMIGCDILTLCDESSYEGARAAFERFKEEGAVRNVEVNLKRQDGGMVPTVLNISAVRDKEQRIRFGRASMRDVSELKSSLVAREQAEKANLAKTHFLANMSHEIRTPLSSILAYGQILAEETLPSTERQSFIFALRKNAQYLGELVNDILDVSKIEAGKFEMERVKCSFMNEMAETYFLLRSRAKNAGTQLLFEFQGKIPRYIHTDPVRLRQIIMNIVGNAIKFSTGKSVEVTIALIKLNAGHGLSFVVKDTGIGISAEGREKLFALFSQEDTSTTRKFGGTGLGLYLSKRLALALDGDVRLLHSLPGQGSTFEVTVDVGLLALDHLQEGLSMADFDSLLEMGASTAAAERLGRLNGMRILLAEDNSDLQFAFTRVLSRSGARVECVANGEQAVDKALHTDDRFHVVFMDLQMPVMDGYTAVARLRTEGYGEPIVAVTAVLLQEEIEKCMSHGFSECIPKPSNYDELISCAAKYMPRLG